MTVVRIPPVLREQVGDRKQVDAAGDTVGALLDDLVGRQPAFRSGDAQAGKHAPAGIGKRQLPPDQVLKHAVVDRVIHGADKIHQVCFQPIAPILADAVYTTGISLIDRGRYSNSL